MFDLIFPTIDETLLPPSPLVEHSVASLSPSLSSNGADVAAIGRLPNPQKALGRTQSFTPNHEAQTNNLGAYEKSDYNYSDGYHVFYLSHPDDIKAWLRFYDIEDYHLEHTERGWVVDAAQSVILTGRDLFFVPIRFRSVKGDFSVANNLIKTLEFGPEAVGGHYDCSHNRLTSLFGVATSIKGTLNASYNPLESLDDLPLDCSKIGAITLRHVSRFPKYLHTTDPIAIAQDIHEAKIIAQKQHIDTQMKQMLMAETVDNLLSTVIQKVAKI